MVEDLLDFKKKRMRSYFLSLEEKPEISDNQEKKQEDLNDFKMTYIQLHLPIEKITSEVENKLKNEIEHNILHAKIREASEEDLKEVLNMYNKAWMTSNEPFTPMRMDSISKIFNLPEVSILIANVYGLDVGFIILDFEGENHEYGVIAGLGIVPRFQRRGVGKILGMSAWNFFKQKGVKELRCEVHADNKASYNFIKSLGFEEYETRIYTKDDFHVVET